MSERNRQIGGCYVRLYSRLWDLYPKVQVKEGRDNLGGLGTSVLVNIFGKEPR